MAQYQLTDIFRKKCDHLTRKHRDLPAAIEDTLAKLGQDPIHHSLNLKMHKGTSLWKIRVPKKDGWRIMLQKQQYEENGVSYVVYIPLDIGNHDIIKLY